jgi:uncharacterized protein YjbI with pentapeptide repeats
MNQVLQTLLATGAVGAIAGLIGVLVAQRRTTERHRQTLLEARNLDANRALETALQSYFEEMGKLLADPTRPLRSAEPGDDLSALARAQTLSTLQRLNNPLLGSLGNDVQYNNRVRKGILLRFLYESGLINKDKPVIDLFDVNLAEVMWLYATLRGTDLRGADLSGAILSGADLNGADLTRADLTEATLVRADLREANLRETDFS